MSVSGHFALSCSHPLYSQLYRGDNYPDTGGYINQANAIDRLWGPSGLARAALHAVVGGAAWGAVGALASASNVLTETALSNLVKAAMSGMGLSPDDTALYNVILATAKTALSGALGGAQGATAAFNADANNRQLHPDEAKLIMSKRGTFKQRLQAKGMTVTDEQAEKLLTATVEASVKLNTSAGGILNMFNGEAAKEAKLYINEIGAQAGSFTDSRGFNIKYFTLNTTDGQYLRDDLRKNALYASEYNTVELQDFAWRTQALNLIGSNPTLEASNNYISREKDKNKQMAVAAAALLAPATLAVTLNTLPALGLAAKACISNLVLCGNQLSLWAGEVAAGDALGGATVVGGLAAAKNTVALIESKVVQAVADENIPANLVKQGQKLEDALGLNGPQAIATIGASINARKVCEFACEIGGLNANEQVLMGKIAAGMDRDAQGALTEQLMNSVAQRSGFSVLGGNKYGSNNGFDLVLQARDGAVTIIVDAKQMTPGGAIRLSNQGAGGTNQLSSEWVSNVIDNIKNTNPNSPAVAAIEAAVKSNTLRTAVAAVNRDSKQLLVVPVYVPNQLN